MLPPLDTALSEVRSIHSDHLDLTALFESTVRQIIMDARLVGQTGQSLSQFFVHHDLKPAAGNTLLRQNG